MNREWMRQRLESFKVLCEAYQDERRGVSDSLTTRQHAITDQMAYQMPTVREILKRLDLALSQQVKPPQYLGGAADSLRAVQQGLGILRDWIRNVAAHTNHDWSEQVALEHLAVLSVVAR
jgi:hypothetical protein